MGITKWTKVPKKLVCKCGAIIAIGYVEYPPDITPPSTEVIDFDLCEECSKN